MFLSDESEIERLRKENRELIQNHDAAVKTVRELNKIIKKMEQRYAELIDLTSAPSACGGVVHPNS